MRCPALLLCALVGCCLTVVLAPGRACAEEQPDPTEKPDDPPPHEERSALPLAPPPTPPSPPVVTFDYALSMGQVFLAAAIPIVDMALMLGSSRLVPATIAMAIASPLLVGGSVCLLGNLSSRYHGSCIPPLVGGILGAAAAVPLGFLGDYLGRNNSDVNLGGFYLAAASWFVLQPALAVAAWHLFRRPRAPAATPVMRDPSIDRGPLADGRRGPGSATPRQTIVPLLSLAF
jgi:hypothetical protein